MGKEAPPLDRIIQDFLLCCAAEGKSPRTIEWYRANLTRFSTFLKSQGLGQSLLEIGTTEARSFILHLQNDVKRWESCPSINDHKGLSPFSVQGYARTIKAFWSWLLNEGYIDSNPMSRLKLPRVPQKIIATFSPEQVQKLLDALDRGKSSGCRDYVIILVLFDTGVRLSELVSLTLEDVDLEQGCFLVKGKGNKERNVPFGSQVRRALWRYVTRFRPEPAFPQNTQLFLSNRGFPLKRRAVQSALTRLGRKANITGIRSSPHTFRHSFAKQFLLNGGNVFTLQRILGHSSLEVVKIYVNLTSGDIQNQHKQFSPADNMAISSTARRANYRVSATNEASATSWAPHRPIDRTSSKESP